MFKNLFAVLLEQRKFQDWSTNQQRRQLKKYGTQWIIINILDHKRIYIALDNYVL